MWCKLCGENYAVKAMWCKICGASCVMQSMWYKLCGASFAAAHRTPTRRPRAGTRRNLGTPAQRGAGGAHEALTSGRGAKPRHAHPTHGAPTKRQRAATNRAPGENPARPSNYRKAQERSPGASTAWGMLFSTSEARNLTHDESHQPFRA